MDISVTVPDLPGPGATVLGGGAAYAPGGKGANQAVAAARLGAYVRMVGCVGDDDSGARLRQALRDEGVADDGVRTVKGAPTGLAMITVDKAGENMITVAPGANREVGAGEVSAAEAEPADALVISAEIPVAAIRAALAVRSGADAGAGSGSEAGSGIESQGGHRPGLTVLNLAPAPPESAELVALGADWLVVNESEAAAVLKRAVAGQDDADRPDDAARLEDAARAAAEIAAMGARGVVVTAGAAGAAYHAGGAQAGQRSAGGAEAGQGIAGGAAVGQRITEGAQAGQRSAGGAEPGQGIAEGPGADHGIVPGFQVRAVDSVGAGDTFAGALAVALAAGVAPPDAVRAASAAGAAAATRPGTQSGMPDPEAVLVATGHAWPVPRAVRGGADEMREALNGDNRTQQCRGNRDRRHSG